MPRVPVRDSTKVHLPPAWTVAVVLGLVSGCGGETDDAGGGPIRSEGGSQVLSASDTAVVRDAQESVTSYCRARARELGGGKPTSAKDLERVTAALEQLAALAQAKPEAETGDGVTVRLALGDIAENLEGTNCDPRLVELIDSRLAELPPG